MSLPPVIIGGFLLLNLLFSVWCVVDRCLSFCTFSFGHSVVCPSSIYGFGLNICYLCIIIFCTVVKYRCPSIAIPIMNTTILSKYASSYILTVSFIGEINRSTQRKPRTCPQVTNKVYRILLYRVHLAWAWFELTTLVVIGTDYICSCKFNTILTMTVPWKVWKWYFHKILEYFDRVIITLISYLTYTTRF